MFFLHSYDGDDETTECFKDGKVWTSRDDGEDHYVTHAQKLSKISVAPELGPVERHQQPTSRDGW
jgi:hypothetical protein